MFLYYVLSNYDQKIYLKNPEKLEDLTLEERSKSWVLRDCVQSEENKKYGRKAYESDRLTKALLQEKKDSPE